MTEQTNPSPSGSGAEDKFNRIIAVAIALVTLLTAVLAYVQSDASSRDDQANRDSKRYSIEAFGRQVSGDARVNFDDNVAYQTYYELSLLANSAYNRGDEAASDRFLLLMDETTQLSPLLAPPYYDSAGEAEPDLWRYEADIYVGEMASLREKFMAASAVKDTWDSKANTYIIHITLLAVSLFLFGLSTTISRPGTRWIFAGAGAIVTLVAIVWAATVYVKPVFDLRQQGNAIDDYAQGVGLAYQERYDEAVTSFDKAIQAYPAYANAYAERAAAYMGLGDYQHAAADYESAWNNGNKTSSIAGELAWAYFLLSDFDRSIDMNRTALQSSPDELWIQFDLALSLLASGQIDSAQAEYKKGMDMAAAQVAEAKAAGQEPPSYLWWGMLDAAQSLELLLGSLDTGDFQVLNPQAIAPAGERLIVDLKNLAVALEYSGKPPQGQVSAQFSPFSFVAPIVDEDGEVVEYTEPLDTFEYGIDEFSVLFDYEGMQDGQEIVFKLYIDGEEDPSWRIVDSWLFGESGSAEIPISYAYSDTFVFDPGEYVVELYVDYQLVQQGYFTIEE